MLCSGSWLHLLLCGYFDKDQHAAQLKRSPCSMEQRILSFITSWHRWSLRIGSEHEVTSSPAKQGRQQQSHVPIVSWGEYKVGVLGEYIVLHFESVTSPLCVTSTVLTWKILVIGEQLCRHEVTWARKFHACSTSMWLSAQQDWLEELGRMKKSLQRKRHSVKGLEDVGKNFHKTAAGLFFEPFCGAFCSVISWLYHSLEDSWRNKLIQLLICLWFHDS